jgi:hypothetical protein
MKLKTLEVNAFGAINPNSPVIIDFTESKFVNVTGDQGLGKTTLINALLVACGQLSKDNKNFVNDDTGKIDINFEFVGKDRCNYSVRCTKSKFELTYDGEALPEPVTKMKELLGVVGVSPMTIKNEKLNIIVKWLSTYSNKSPEEFEKELAKHKDNRKKAMDTRAAANKSYKALKETLENDPMYNDWEGSEKRYAQEVDIKDLSKQLQEAGNKSDKYIRAEERVKSLKQERPNLVTRIENIKKQLLEAENALIEQDKSIVSGEEYLTNNKQDKTNYDSVKKKYDTAAQDVVDYKHWQTVKHNKIDMDEYETISQNADAKEKEIAQAIKDLQADILPDIKGVEMYTEDTVEDGVTYKEGLYWKGKNVAQLSESEWWEVVLEIWRKYKVKIVVIDNASNLGSKAHERLEKLANDGCYILAAEMNREQKTLSISYE